MDYQQLIDNMTPEIFERLKRAVETGRWPDGREVSAEQREHAMQAVIAWGEKHLDSAERVGFIDTGDKGGESCDDEQASILRWRD